MLEAFFFLFFAAELRLSPFFGVWEVAATFRRRLRDDDCADGGGSGLSLALAADADAVDGPALLVALAAALPDFLLRVAGDFELGFFRPAGDLPSDLPGDLPAGDF